MRVSTASGRACSKNRAQQVARVLAREARTRLALSQFCKCATRTRSQLLQQYRLYNKDWRFELVDLRAPMPFEADAINGLGTVASSAAIAVNPNLPVSTILYLELPSLRTHRQEYAAWILPADPFGLAGERCS